MADEHDDDGSDDEENQYGGSTQNVDAVEQTERITDGEEPGGEDDGEEGQEAEESNDEDS